MRPPVSAQIPCVTAGTCSPFSALPPWTVPGITVNPLQTTGNYNFQSFIADHQNDYLCNTSDNQSCIPQGVNFADPYYGGRGPQFINYNFGIQKMINKKAVLSVNYSGSQTHFLPEGAGRGYATNAYSPDYSQLLQLNLAQPAGGAETAIVQNLLPGYSLPYPLFQGSSATVFQSLRPFPQFAGLTDLWGNTGNANYNSIQFMVIQRPWHNLSGFMNYTRSKEIDDVGHHRTQFPLGPQDGNFPHSIPANQVDRGLGQYNQTNAFNLTWVYTFPIGRGQAFFATNRIAALVGGGWQFSGIYKYRDGYPLQITSSLGCKSNSGAGQGTCMPDYAPGFNKKRHASTADGAAVPEPMPANINDISYLNPTAFECPDSPVTDQLSPAALRNPPVEPPGRSATLLVPLPMALLDRDGGISSWVSAAPSMFVKPPRSTLPSRSRRTWTTPPTPPSSICPALRGATQPTARSAARTRASSRATGSSPVASASKRSAGLSKLCKFCRR